MDKVLHCILLFLSVPLVLISCQQRQNIQNYFWCEHTDLYDDLNFCRKGSLHVDVLETSSSASTSSGFVNYEQILQDANNRICNQVDEYTTQLVCKHNAIDKCLDSEYKDFLPNKYSLADAVRYMCTNINDLNEDCLQENLALLGDCLLGRGFSNPTEIQSSAALDYTCKMYSYAKTCVGVTFRRCGPAALKIYKNVMNYLQPVACSDTVRSTGNWNVTFVCLFLGMFLNIF